MNQNQRIVNRDIERVCSSCNEIKLYSNFHLQKGKYRSKCKQCASAYAKNRYANIKVNRVARDVEPVENIGV